MEIGAIFWCAVAHGLFDRTGEVRSIISPSSCSLVRRDAKSDVLRDHCLEMACWIGMEKLDEEVMTNRSPDVAANLTNRVMEERRRCVPTTRVARCGTDGVEAQPVGLFDWL